MGLSTDLDLGGNTLLVKDIKTGASAPGQTSTTLQSSAAGSTLTATNAANAGKMILLNTASGSTVTLPASTGSGNSYEFVVSVTVTSNNHVVKVANASDTMVGFAIVRSAAGAAFYTVTASDTITMNGTTTGGVIGSHIMIKDVATNVWSVRANLVGSGTAATPFGATV